MTDIRMTTPNQVRQSFWNNNNFVRYPGKTQNDYPVDVRMAFVDYVDMLARDGYISQALAQRVTL